jgi:hypothetical protein
MENYSTSKPLNVSPEKSQILSCDTVVANERFVCVKVEHPCCVYRTDGYIRKQSTQLFFKVFNKATCFGLLGDHQANTCNIRHRRETQKYLAF